CSSSVSTSSAFGRPITMLISPVPLISASYVNIGQLTTERDTSKRAFDCSRGSSAAHGTFSIDHDKKNFKWRQLIPTPEEM
ncbi:hypothetical protein VSR68_39880, partial [Paraburkholderia phymatum]|uniref:hypothetical protein n=1 Tax=Paraburkholderia phymatum TaxID=148447 RepID=UPI00316C0225